MGVRILDNFKVSSSLSSAWYLNGIFEFLDNVIAIDIWPFGCWNMKTACGVIEFVNEHTPTEETKIP